MCDYDAAEEEYNAALELLLPQNDLLNLAIVYNNLGLLNMDKSDWPQAEAMFQCSVRLRQSIRQDLHLADTLNDLAFVQIKLDRHEEARASLQRALSCLPTPLGHPLAVKLHRQLQEKLALMRNRNG